MLNHPSTPAILCSLISFPSLFLFCLLVIQHLAPLFMYYSHLDSFPLLHIHPTNLY